MLRIKKENINCKSVLGQQFLTAFEDMKAMMNPLYREVRIYKHYMYQKIHKSFPNPLGIHMP